MNVTYEQKPEMTLIGFHTQILPQDGATECPKFWDEAYNARFSRLWQTMKPETPLEQALLTHKIGQFAICNEHENSFDYWIAGLYVGGEVPEGLALFTFPASEWAVFTAKGPFKETFQALNAKVWNEWFPTEGKQMISGNNAMLEVYSPGDMNSPDYESGIWVPVCRK